MPRVRRVVPMLMLAAVTARPAYAETCSLTLQGAPILDDEPCTTHLRANVLRVEQGNAVTVVVRRSVLSTNLVVRRSSLRPERPRLRSFGQVVKSDSNDDKLCYFNQKVTFCIDR